METYDTQTNIERQCENEADGVRCGDGVTIDAGYKTKLVIEGKDRISAERNIHKDRNNETRGR